MVNAPVFKLFHTVLIYTLLNNFSPIKKYKQKNGYTATMRLYLNGVMTTKVKFIISRYLHLSNFYSNRIR